MAASYRWVVRLCLVAMGTVLGLAIASAIGYTWFWQPFIRESRLINRPPPESWEKTASYLGRPTLKRIGNWNTGRKSSFVNFSRSKSPGNVHVCAFGDSFTYGAEVADGYDFPALLQNLFLKSGMGNVEVLNFGNSGWGFQQAYLLWRDVGRSYNCDFVLFGPRGWYRDRDVSFQHLRSHPYAIHARFIWKDDGLELVEPVGSDYTERFEAYWGFVPYWRYLRYDRNPPASLQALAGRGRTLPNPFYYYRGSVREETQKINRRLLERLAYAGPGIVTGGPWSAGLQESVWGDSGSRHRPGT